ncbi:MAG: right-handed parallel beta-helix repeat-containing protein [Candidatus Zipacnadales bacterium]
MLRGLMIVASLSGSGWAAPLYVNGGFEALEAINDGFLAAARAGQITLSQRVPQVWQINTGALAARQQEHLLQLVDDSQRAHGGQHALELRPGEIFLPAVPVKGGARVKVTVFATGQPGLTLGVQLAEREPQNLYPPLHPVGEGTADNKGYVQYATEVELPETARRMGLTLGATEALIDDFTLEIEGTNVRAPLLNEAPEADEDTLVLANGDRQLPEGSVFTGKMIEGRFGQAFRLEEEEDLFQIPGRFEALLRAGTIEIWVRPHWPGRDERNHNLAILSSEGVGLQLVRSQYNHIIFSASAGWHEALGNVQSQHWQSANRWAAGDWHHIAVSWTPDWYTLFVDGFPVDTATTDTKAAPNTSYCTGKLPPRLPTLVGLGGPGTDLDEVRISRTPRYWIVAADAPALPPDAPPVAQAPPVPPAESGVEARRPPEEDTAPAPREKPVEFFVDGENPQASDENPGTRERPFKTITRGIKELLPGDTLTVKGGTYREGVEIDLVGTPDNPITIQAAPGETVVIKGSEVVTGWRQDGNVWHKEGWTKEYVTEHFAKGTRLVSPNVMEVFQKDGEGGDAVVLYRVRRPEELREGKCYWDEATGTITIWPYGACDPNAQGVEIPVRGRALTAGRQYVHVRGFRMRQFGMAAVTNWPAAGLHGADCRMEDCVVTWSDFGGLSVSGFRQILRNCEGSYCGNSGLGAGVGEEILVEGCRFTHNNFWRYSPSWHGGGAKLIPWFNKSTVRNSEFAYNYGPGLWLDGSCNDSLLEGNRCHDNEGPGIMVEISRGCLVRNNLCYNNRNTLPGLDLSPVEGQGYAPVNCLVRRVEGGSGGYGIFISSSPHTRVYNNLCYRNEGPGIFAEWSRRDSEDIADYAERKGVRVSMSTHDVDIRNNIVVNNGGTQLSLRRNGVDEWTYNNRSDYNLLFSGSGGSLVTWGFGGVSFTSLEKWKEASGFDEHSVAGAPIFEFSPGLDFRLQPDSPGVDQGELLAEVPSDVRGLPRPLGAGADIGPYEIVGTRQVLQRPAIPADLEFFSVDLSALVNREFADETADDGQGGWTDQGPTTDLRMFPTGEQVFNGVPFTVLAPKGCVVLRSGYRPQSKDLPERITIPVHRRADVLFFLHSGAWLGGGRQQWSYIIRRGDGTQETLRLVDGENIRDWSSPTPALPFDREYPTTTTVAWTGTNQTFEKVSVYMMAWVNTHDWCEVTEIEMVASEGGGVPILIAVTGGLRK